MKIIAPIGLGVLLLLGVALFALSRQRAAVHALPLKVICQTLEQASQQSKEYCDLHNAVRFPIAGTGSVAPYIPAAQPGEDPMRVVAYAVSNGGRYTSITAGALVCYKPSWSVTPVMHQAEACDAYGWIMTGLHNAHSESSWRVTEDNFIAIIDLVFVVE